MANQEHAVDQRLSQRTAARLEKESATKKEAAELLAATKQERCDMIAVNRREHEATQEADMKLRDELTSTGALWPSVLTLVDTAKPNAHTKRGTELMRSTFIELKQGKCPGSGSS